MGVSLVACVPMFLRTWWNKRRYLQLKTKSKLTLDKRESITNKQLEQSLVSLTAANEQAVTIDRSIREAAALPYKQGRQEPNMADRDRIKGLMKQAKDNRVRQRLAQRDVDLYNGILSQIETKRLSDDSVFEHMSEFTQELAHMDAASGLTQDQRDKRDLRTAQQIGAENERLQTNQSEMSIGREAIHEALYLSPADMDEPIEDDAHNKNNAKLTAQMDAIFAEAQLQIVNQQLHGNVAPTRSLSYVDDSDAIELDSEHVSLQRAH